MTVYLGPYLRSIKTEPSQDHIHVDTAMKIVVPVERLLGSLRCKTGIKGLANAFRPSKDEAISKDGP